MAKAFQPNPKILKRIASVFHERGSASKTSLHLASRLRWDLSTKYLEWMQVHNYIVFMPVGGVKAYVLTQAGIEMFQSLTTFLSYMK